jgi:hypothetical protein
MEVTNKREIQTKGEIALSDIQTEAMCLIFHQEPFFKDFIQYLPHSAPADGKIYVMLHSSLENIKNLPLSRFPAHLFMCVILGTMFVGV